VALEEAPERGTAAAYPLLAHRMNHAYPVDTHTR
jgi:hypothetical protein